MKISIEQFLNTTDYQNHYLIYSRKSTDDSENQKNTIEYQVGEALRLSSQSDIRIAPIVCEGFCTDGIIREHHSAYKTSESFEILSDGRVAQKIVRPKFLHLVKLAQLKRIKGIIVLCWDRLSRNETDDSIIKTHIKDGLDVQFVQTTYEQSSAGQLHMDIDGMFSRHYSRVISQKVKDAYKKLSAEDRCLSRSPIGYLDRGSDNKPFDPERAPLVKRCFELYAQGGWSFETLSQWANQNNLTTKPTRLKRTKREIERGVDVATKPKISRPLTRKTIEYMLKNPFYIGKRVEKGILKDSIAHTACIFQMKSIPG